MKKALSILIAMLVIIAITIPCFSAAGTPAPLNTATKVGFTVECNKADYEFTVYKIASLTTSSASPYSVKYTPLVSNSAVKTAIADGNLSAADRKKIVDALDRDTALSGASVVGTYKVNTDGTSKEFSNLDQGIYYVRATNFPAGVRSVQNSAFALPYYTEADGWIYSLDSNIALASKVAEDVPTIEKKITNSTKGNVNYTDVSLGDTVNFEIKTSTVGSVNAVSVLDFKLKSYYITDIMSKGLTLNQNSFAVALQDASGNTLSTLATSDYTVSVTATDGEPTNFTVTLKPAYLNRTDFYSAAYVVTTYSAVLNKHAVVGTAGNPNQAVKLTYSNKTNVVGEVAGNTVYAYTYKLQVNKKDDAGNKLAGAEFALYDTEANANAETNPIATGTSDTTSGLVVFKNANGDEILLQSGTYYVKETSAPAGYNRYTALITREITATYKNAFDSVTNTWVDTAPTNGISTFEVKNSKTVLPQTGGIGNSIFYILAGMSALCAAAFVLFAVKKRSKQ